MCDGGGMAECVHTRAAMIWDPPGRSKVLVHLSMGAIADIRRMFSIKTHRPEGRIFARSIRSHYRAGQVGWKAGFSFWRNDGFL